MAVVLIGTLDTKGEELDFAREIIEAHDIDVHLIDVGVMEDPDIEPDTSAHEVAEAAGTSLEHLREEADRGEAIETMGDGAAAIASRLHDDGLLEGVVGLGGSGNTSIATTAMRALPVGIPKLMVSTMASGDTEPYVGAKDVMMLYSVADIEGLNQLSRRVISNAALAMVGMVANEPDISISERPTVGITMFGVTTPCVHTAREYLESEGYETIVFHATGTGGRAMEELVRQGLIDGVLDITTTEWADELVGGVLSAGETRLDAAAETGIPQVVSVGALDMVNFGPRDSVPDVFEDRKFHIHNPQVTLMRTTPEENAELGEIIAGKLNAATGPTALFLPLDGVSIIDVEGEDFYDPEADSRLFDALRENLDDDVELIELDAAINDDEFATATATKLDEYLRTADGGQ
ncbi:MULTISPECIES: Tm-1-like ATP-binding domain-containing protein [unclassified Haladaptatus]|uniref:Tm-1-like ATP-binding domain-containing protein n=1 Tax=unclassified Haladaptatus TaxID=2622732 RepID=UPI00209C62C0|nr:MULTISPECIES: Tm-1-like ATP-binding domain-containing protein [unclassified Haladaptatus]MCO8243405.1 Tm-1-like ATP-binding domain-containing protein [Haladaptatus sp. AB643]MCO8254812.1 Tm-1-like ATP-binding domain-containing protein [Haladaptatus sp. AB618]